MGLTFALQESCGKYANSGSWDAVLDDMVWNSHLDLFVNFRRVRIAVDLGPRYSHLRVRRKTDSPLACKLTYMVSFDVDEWCCNLFALVCPYFSGS